jgi:hypothetical protein
MPHAGLGLRPTPRTDEGPFKDGHGVARRWQQPPMRTPCSSFFFLFVSCSTSSVMICAIFDLMFLKYHNLSSRTVSISCCYQFHYCSVLR